MVWKSEKYRGIINSLHHELKINFNGTKSRYKVKSEGFFQIERGIDNLF